MCLFALPVREVASTNIFASAHLHARGLLRQTLVYEARVVTEQPNAIVLPIPVHPHLGAAGITLLDMSAIPDFFPRLADLIGPPVNPASFPGYPGFAPPAAEVLPVHRVGAFHVSIVPTIGDFRRLSGIFALAFRTLEAVLRARYADHAFVVYQFAPGSPELHPFGLSFVTRYAHLYFPTFHVHDGTGPAYAAFDHQLFAQRSELPTKGDRPVNHAPWRDRILPRAPFIDGNDFIETGVLRGVMPNQDTFVGNHRTWLRTLEGPLDCTPTPETVPVVISPSGPSPGSPHHDPSGGGESKRISCSNCGCSLSEGAFFCSMCGRSTLGTAAPAATPRAGAQAPCSKCGWMLSAGAAICDMCGQPAPAGSLNTPPGPRKKPDHEMIQIVIGVIALVVVLFLRFFMGWF
jgi:hypothetical protein